MATLLPNGKQTFVDANGNPVVAGSVYFYIPGTTTAKNTWQDSGQTILNTNPVVLDSAGRAIIYGSGSYRQVVKDSLGNTIWDQVTADTSSGSSSWAGTSAGTVNAQTITATNFTSSDGQSIDFIAGLTNTSALTLNPNGTGPINVLKDTYSGPVSLTGGEVFTGNLARVVYSSATGAFHLTAVPAVNDSAPLTDLASATTTNLGSIVGRNVRITGTTTITSFGSSASTSYPYYNLKFSGSLLLTYNATSLILPTVGNITTAANDTAIALYLGSGNWQIVQYTRAAATASPIAITKRQTVVSGPTDSSGIPNFLPATAGALAITSQNVSSTAPLVVNVSGGTVQFIPSAPSVTGYYSPSDRMGYSTANLTWSSLANTTTNYLFVSVAADGTLTTGSTVTAPIYQYGGTVSVTNGQYTYVIQEGKMYLGNGSTAAQAYVVFVGEAVTSGGTVTGTTAYAYNGLYQYDDTSSFPAASTSTTKLHNLGITTGVSAKLYVVCSTADSGYAIGDIIQPPWSDYGGPTYESICPWFNSKTVGFVTGSSTTLLSASRSSAGARAALTVGSWRYRILVTRDW
jgi:hypothetical protein